ncbi:MAG: hypothetical protein NC225_03200 [Clostridium sp.]|nr:hypothetical protein [Clostridium sp.]MCM1398472.1 hypothetical protein [Clostridium sp.]MCM1460194.1 hypothetical protein [Bacteroides sp.]
MGLHTLLENKQLLKALNEDYDKWDGTLEYEQSDYMLGWQAAGFKSRLLFVHGNPSGKRGTITEELVKQALEKGFEVATTDKWKDRLGESGNIIYTEKNSVEYFKLLTEAKYIYATSNLNYNFSKTDKQVLIVDLPSYDREDFDNRIRVDSIVCHADHIVKGKKTRKEIFECLLEKKLKTNMILDDKQKVLFIINTNYYDRTLAYILSIQNQIDYTRYDVTVLFAMSVKERFRKQMGRLNPEINVVFRKPSMECDAGTERKLAFLEEKNFDLPDVAVVEKFLGKDVFAKEAAKLFGSKCFDYVFNMKYDGIKWRLFIHALTGKKIFYNLDHYNNPSEWTVSKLKHFGMYDEILFPNEDRLSQAEAFAPEVFCGKSCVLPPPAVGMYENTDTIDIVEGETRFCLADTNIVSDEDSLDVLMVKYPKDKTEYVTISPRCTELYAEERLKEILESGMCPIIFDFGRVLTKNEVTAGLDYYKRYSSATALGNLPDNGIFVEADGQDDRESALDVILSSH